MRKYQATSAPNPIAAESAWDAVLGYLADAKGAQTVMSLFRKMDRNGDKSLNLDELSSGLVSLGVTLSSSEIRAFQKVLDTNVDGKLWSCVDKHVHS